MLSDWLWLGADRLVLRADRLWLRPELLALRLRAPCSRRERCSLLGAELRWEGEDELDLLFETRAFSLLPALPRLALPLLAPRLFSVGLTLPPSLLASAMPPLTESGKSKPRM